MNVLQGITDAEANKMVEGLAVTGDKAAAAVHASIIAGCIGFVALYFIVTSDVLVGNDEFTGILSDLFPSALDPLPRLLTRPWLLTWVALACAPLLATETLHGMATTSAVSRLTLHTNATNPSNLSPLSISSRGGPLPELAARFAASSW